MRRTTPALFAALLLLALSTTARAALTFTFWTVADTSTPVPGSTGNFADFSGETSSENQPPALDGNNVAFLGKNSAGQFGVYRSVNAALSAVANSQTPVPSNTGFNFAYFRHPSISGSNVAFYGGDGNNFGWGIYRSIGASLIRITDASQIAPGAGELFRGFSRTSIDGDDVSFFGDTNSIDGVYRYHNSALNVVANEYSPVPGGSGTFISLNSNVNGARGEVAFQGIDGNSKHGIFRTSASVIVAVANEFTPVPGGAGNFTGFDNVYLSGDGPDAAFVGYDGTKWGIYASVGGVLHAVAVNGQAAPGGGAFGINYAANPLSLDHGRVAFLSNGALYTDLGGFLTRVIGPGQILNGKTISSIRTGADAISGDSIAFVAKFTDGSSGVFVTSLIPEPAGLLLTALLVPFLRRPR